MVTGKVNQIDSEILKYSSNLNVFLSCNGFYSEALTDNFGKFIITRVVDGIGAYSCKLSVASSSSKLYVVNISLTKENNYQIRDLNIDLCVNAYVKLDILGQDTFWITSSVF